MITDRPPRGAKARGEFDQSDALTRLAPLPDARQLQARAALLQDSVATGDARKVKVEGESILGLLAQTYGISRPGLRVLGARPRSVWEGGHSELFGDYDFAEKRIRVWMRTAVLGKVTSYRGLLHTLLHEFCHHLDREKLGFLETPHTRGFHARVDDLYHLALATPPEKRRPLVWIRMGSAWRIDWSRLRSSRSGNLSPSGDIEPALPSDEEKAMTKVALFVRLQAKPGKEAELEKFLAGALPLAQGEARTPVWFALKFGKSEFGIFDAFADEAGRKAHLDGPIAAALMARAGDLLAQAPKIERVDLLASKVER